MIRAPAPAPPVGKKRRHMPLMVKLEAALRALGLDPKDVEWQHEPPIAMRVWVPERGDYDPPENDPRYIRPMPKAEHREVTAKRDIPAIAKTKRLSRKHEELRRRMLEPDAEPEPPGKRGKRKIPSRPFPKRTSR